MTEEQYNQLTKTLQTIINNQVILDRKLNDIQSDVSVCISNQKILGRDQDELIETVNKMKKVILK